MFRVAMFVLFCLSMLAGCAGEGKAIAMTILEPLVTMMFTIATPILLALFAVLLKRMKTKHDFEIGKENQLKLEQLIVDGLHYANEQARQAIKNGGQLPPDAKLSKAVKFVTDQINAFGLPQLAGEEIAQLIEAKLSQHRPAMDEPKTPAVVSRAIPEADSSRVL